MANVRAKIIIKYQTREFDNSKEVRQHFQNFKQEIFLSDDNFTLLKAFLEGAVNEADGTIE